jgi:hypothetical protein
MPTFDLNAILASVNAASKNIDDVVRHGTAGAASAATRTGMKASVSARAAMSVARSKNMDTHRGNLLKTNASKREALILERKTEFFEVLKNPVMWYGLKMNIHGTHKKYNHTKKQKSRLDWLLYECPELVTDPKSVTL